MTPVTSHIGDTPSPISPSARLGGVMTVLLSLTVLAFFLALAPFDSEQGWRSPFALPAIFWIPMTTGFGSFLIAGWVWSLRPADLATRLFALSGIATLAFTFAPAITYSTRLDLPETVSLGLSLTNSIGASAFGITMIALCLVYPARLPGLRIWMTLNIGVFGLATLGTLLEILPRAFGVHLITSVEMVCIVIAVVGQLLHSRRDPTQRAIALWLGLAILFGAGGFIVTTAAPSVFNGAPLIPAVYSFGFFLLIYIGIAAGLRRFRLFELGEWAYRVFFYVVGSALLVLVDITLVILLPIGPGMAFGAALIIVALVYLPLRDVFARMLLPRPDLSDDQVFKSIVDVALEPDTARRTRLWQGLMQRLFKPIEVEACSFSGSEAVTGNDGVELYIPAISQLPAIRLRYPWNGRGLFGPPHQRTAARLAQLLSHVESGRQAYDRGVSSERQRIARDMHDNIGAQLLSALHSSDQGRKDTMIRESLSDLRDIINDNSASDLSLEEVLSDLRAETAERCAGHGIELGWALSGTDNVALAPAASHALRSVIREIVSNSIKHARASMLDISIAASADRLEFSCRDNGQGFDPATITPGNGLDNLENRVSALGGELTTTPSKDGVETRGSFPVQTPEQTS